MDNKKLNSIVLSQNLTAIPTTESRDGYPTNEQRAIVGFGTFAEAEAFARANSLRVMLLHRCDGWDFYDVMGELYERPTLDESDYGGIAAYTKRDLQAHEEDFIGQIRDIIDDTESLEEIVHVTAAYKKLLDAIRNLGDGEAVIQYEGDIDNFEVKPICPMEWDYDTHHYQVAVF